MIYKSYLVEENINIINENLTLFYGENLGLKGDFKKKIRHSNEDAKIITFTQEEIFKNENIFYNEIVNISLFDEKKIYFIDQASDKIIDKLQEIDGKIDGQKIFLFSELLDKRSKLRNYFEKSKATAIVPCYADNEITIKKIILKKLKSFEGLSSQNVNLIIDNSNLNRVKLNNELSKITSYFTNKKIDNKKLEVLLDNKINDDFSLLKDEALNGNTIKTNGLLSETMIDNEKNILYLNIINQRLNKLIEVSELAKTKNLENAVSIIRPPIFWKDKTSFMIQARKWSPNKIKSILKKTYEIEVNIKSNPIINKNLLLKKLIVDICVLANSS